MSGIEELHGRVRSISDIISGALRPVQSNPSIAGWGQFLEAASPVFQIGPYGTAAGIVVNQIAYPSSPVDSRVRAQLRAFWEAKPEGKLFLQNVRLAFTVLALGKTREPELVELRDEVANELRKRQLSDGSWSELRPTSDTDSRRTA